RDRAAIEKLRKQAAAADQDRLAELTRDRCPKCGARLQAVEHHGSTVEECPNGHGTWLDAGELQTIANRERDSWLRPPLLPRPRACRGGVLGGARGPRGRGGGGGGGGGGRAPDDRGRPRPVPARSRREHRRERRVSHGRGPPRTALRRRRVARVAPPDDARRP